MGSDFVLHDAVRLFEAGFLNPISHFRLPHVANQRDDRGYAHLKGPVFRRQDLPLFIRNEFEDLFLIQRLQRFRVEGGVESRDDPVHGFLNRHLCGHRDT